MRGGGNAVLIPTEYDNIHFEFSGFMIANKGGKEGVINEANEPIIPFEYKSLDILYRSQVGQVPKGVPLTELRLLARKDGNLWGILDGYGQVVFPFVVCDQPPRVMHFYEAERSAGGEIRSYPLNYENVRRRTAIYFDNSEKPALVNADGQPILTGFEKLNFVTFLNNVAYVNVQKEVKWGIYNLHGKWVTEAKYAYEPYLVEGTEDKKAPFFVSVNTASKGPISAWWILPGGRYCPLPTTTCLWPFSTTRSGIFGYKKTVNMPLSRRVGNWCCHFRA